MDESIGEYGGAMCMIILGAGIIGIMVRLYSSVISLF